MAEPGPDPEPFLPFLRKKRNVSLQIARTAGCILPVGCELPELDGKVKTILVTAAMASPLPGEGNEGAPRLGHAPGSPAVETVAETVLDLLLGV